MASTRKTTFVSVDFGTTYSGWAFTIGKEHTEYFVSPDTGGKKVPTVLLLNNDSCYSFKEFGEDALDFMKNDADEGMNNTLLFDRFKMKLHSDKNVHSAMPIKATNCEKTLPARVVFSRALQYFYSAATKRVAAHTGTPFDANEVQWMITVPAIWGDRAKHLMREAAQQADMGSGSSITIVLEPEAASLACRDDLLPVWRSLNRPERVRYMVVDCGGGTIDIAVHDVSWEKKKIRQAWLVDGGPWGGTFVDDEIEKIVVRVIGKKILADQSPSCLFHLYRQYMHEAKLRIDGRAQVPMDLPYDLKAAIMSEGYRNSLPGEAMPGVSFRGKHQYPLLFDIAVLEKCFKQSLDSIVATIKQLLSDVQGIQCLMFVGGYSESPLLFNRVKSEFHRDHSRYVIRPGHASLAVVKGAVMYGQNPNMIESRWSKYTYGINSYVLFDSAKHESHRKYHVPDGEVGCIVFSKRVEVGEEIEIGQKIRSRHCPIYAKQTTMSFKFYRTMKACPKYVDEPGVEHLSTMVVSMPDTTKGIDRLVVVELDFSRTEIHATAYDVDNPSKIYKIKMDFHYEKPTY